MDPRSTGRGLGAIPQGPTGGTELPNTPGGAISPFATYAPSSGEMQAEAERRREDSLGVMAIVGGLTFMVGSAIIVLIAVLLVGLFMTLRPENELAGGDEAEGGILDTAVAEVGPAKGGGGGGKGPKAPEEDPTASGPQPGPATMIIPPDAFYHSIEINCPGGFKGRARFKKGRATVYNVPPDERCIVTFQGANYVKDWISGHQTKMCTQFDPVPICRER